MKRPEHRETEHEITIEAPAAAVYQLIADVGNWPRLFPPTVYVDHVEKLGDSERIRIWATANGEVKTWTSRRSLDPIGLRIDFRQEVSSPPVAAMGGAWVIEPLASGTSRVRLLHNYRAIDDAGLAWIDRAVDRNSHSELAALKSGAEAAAGGAGLRFSFEDSVVVNGAVRDVYGFIADAALWKERLPHVKRLILTEDTPGMQVMEMDTLTKDGTTHTTKSVRVCFPSHMVVYKQTTMPALLSMHTGTWLVHEDPGNGSDVTVTSEHTVSIAEDNITTVLGPDADVAQAREFVRNALGGNSRATLQHAKEYAESRS
ncbi:aromatase/cyclase [Streptomyces phaeochromogenes]